MNHRSSAFVWTLRVGVLTGALGLLRIVYVDGTAVGTTMFMTLGWSEAFMLAVERTLAWTAFACAAVAVVRTVRPALVFVAAWFFLVAVATWYQGGSFGSAFAVPAHATRYLLPLALIASAWPMDSMRRARLAERILQVAAAATFAAHGVEALAGHPRFIDYIITAFRRVGFAFSEQGARHLLIAIGVQDLFLAALILARRWRAVAGYMAFWGAITAGSRMVHMGLAKWPATLVRAANVAVPLALYLAWRPVGERSAGIEKA